MLEHMGLRVLDEQPHRIAPQRRAAGLDPRLRPAERDRRRRGRRSTRCARCSRRRSARILRGEVESDDFNRLVLAARTAGAARSCCCAPMRSTCGRSASRCRRPSSRRRWPRTPPIARAAGGAVQDPLRPGARRRARGARGRAGARDRGARSRRVENLSEDRVLRQYLALIQATTRTNFWRRDAAGQRRSFVSFKFDPAQGARACPSRSRCSRSSSTRRASRACTCAAARSRAAACAGRTGREDFRTEVLGLVKAQMVKNTVIVPVGSKGGFVLKRAPPAGRPRGLHGRGRRLLPGLPARPARHHRQPRRRRDRAAAATWCATTATTPTWWSPPTRARRPSPTTPTPSARSTASGSATRSPRGGSVGYDHKAMGITARGAWESVKRHFRELGVDTQTEPTSRVAGIGDMSGDVFGNGMLLSRHIRLVAAFDHRHIFLDPDARSGRAQLRRARAPVRAAALVVGRLRREPDLGRAAASIRAAPSRSRSRPRSGAVLGDRRRGDDADRARQRDPEGAGRPALQRRHRHLRQGERRDARAGRRPRQRRACASTAASCAARWSAKAATSAARSSGASSSRWPAGASTPTRSTTRPASTPRTTRSTSRSCSACRSPRAR